jgi:hypothetical protein
MGVGIDDGIRFHGSPPKNFIKNSASFFVQRFIATNAEG